MPVLKNPDTKHPCYKRYVQRWQLIRDFVAGAFAVKEAAQLYLPMLTAQSENEYASYKFRALFLGATQRTLNGFVGMIFRKPPKIEASDDSKEEFLKRCTSKRKAFVSLARQSCRELLQMGRFALLVDIPEEAPANSDPWISVYPAENILNWEYGEDEKGDPLLIHVILREEVEEKEKDDPDETCCVTQWRELELINGIYTVTIWRKEESNDKKGFVIVDGPRAIVANGRTLDQIPLVLTDLSDDEGELNPPMEPVAQVNHSHYLSSADLEHGRHFTALPTPWATGVTSKDTQLKIGSQTAWMIGEATAKVGMLEFTGLGLGALEKAIEQKMSMMAVLGARLLEEPKRAVEAADTHQTRRGEEQSVLAAIALAAQQALNNALKLALLFKPTLGEITTELNTEFSVIQMDPQELTALVAALQSGAISEEVFFYNLEQAEMYPLDHTFEDEQKQRDAANQRRVDAEVSRLKAMPADNLSTP